MICRLNKPFTLSATMALTLLLIISPAQMQESHARGIKATITGNWQTLASEGKARLQAHDLPGAESYFQQALAACRRTKSASADQLAGCMLDLAAVLDLQNKTEDVIPLYKKALKLEQRKYGKRSGQTVPILLMLGDVYEREIQYPRATLFYKCALENAQTQEPRDELLVAKCQHLLGRAYLADEKIPEAQKLFDASLTSLLAQQNLPGSQPLESLLADYLNSYRKASEGERIASSKFGSALLKDKLADLPMTAGVPPSHFATMVSAQLASSVIQNSAPNVIPDKNAQTGAPADEAQLPEFEQLHRRRVDFYERMIATDIDSLGANHPSVARDLNGLASLYIARHEYEKARPLLERSREIFSTTYGDSAALTRRTSELIASISESDKESQVNVGASNDLLSSLPRLPLTAQKLEIALRLNRLALYAYSRGNLDNADKFYNWALADTVQATGENSPLVAACLTDYSRVLRRRGESARAERMDQLAHNIMRWRKANEPFRYIP